jgi:hypothetical protein
MRRHAQHRHAHPFENICAGCGHKFRAARSTTRCCSGKCYVRVWKVRKVWERINPPPAI